MASKTPAKKTINRRRQKPVAEAAEIVRHEPAGAPGPDSPIAAPKTGAVQMSADPQKKLMRLMNNLMAAEDAAAEYGAIADGLLDRVNALEAENATLKAHVRELELQLFNSTESDGDADEKEE